MQTSLLGTREFFLFTNPIFVEYFCKLFPGTCRGSTVLFGNLVRLRDVDFIFELRLLCPFAARIASLGGLLTMYKWVIEFVSFFLFNAYTILPTVLTLYSRLLSHLDYRSFLFRCVDVVYLHLMSVGCRLAMANGGRKTIRSAACLIIGDEVLNGKILDTNSHEFAKVCFQQLSIPLKKTIVCGDDKDDIIRSLEVLKQEGCDLLVTSGGIGPTHDDITYEAIARAYGLPCTVDPEVKSRMYKIRGDYLAGLDLQQTGAFLRMATVPQANLDTSVEKVFSDESLWVPIVGIDHQVYILPGVPQLFKRLLGHLAEYIKDRVVPNSQQRFFVKTETKESELAPFLTDLQHRCDLEYAKNAVKIGSYPHFAWSLNTISIIGDSSLTSGALRKIVNEVVSSIGGHAQEISAEEEDKLSILEPNREEP